MYKNVVLFTSWQEVYLATCNNIHEPGRYAKWNKPDPENTLAHSYMEQKNRIWSNSLKRE